jgi:hypothetical protein
MAWYMLMGESYRGSSLAVLSIYQVDMQLLKSCVLGTLAVFSSYLEIISELRSSFYYRMARRTSHPSSKIH